MANEQSRQTTSSPIGIFPHLALPQPVTLVIPGYTHDDSAVDLMITDSEGTVICSAIGSSLSFSGQKVFADVSGQPLFTVRKKALCLVGSHEGIHFDGSTVFEIHGEWTLTSLQMNAKITNAADGRSLDIIVKGNWKKKEAQIILLESGHVLATLSRESRKPWKLFGSSSTSYFVHVASDVDLALVAALSVMFDEQQLEKRG